MPRNLARLRAARRCSPRYRAAPMSRPKRVVIVGASLAGLRSAQALRRLGHAGEIVAIGDEPQPPYDRPPLSKQLLAGVWDAVRTRLLRPEDDALAVEWRLGAGATSLDLGAREVGLASGERVAYDALVIATGSGARRIPNTPPLAGIHVLRTLDDALALRAELEHGPRVAVIGAGFIGMEVAATCRARGLEVSVVEALPAPLERGLGRELGRYVGDIHREHGVDLRCGVGVARFLGGERVEGLELADGTRIAANVVLVGIGSVPNTSWLASSGLELADGVVCDAACRTTRAPEVVAVGDVARWPNELFDAESMRVEHWTNATEQADHAAATLLAGPGEARPFCPVPFVWSDQFDCKLQIAGRVAPGDEAQLVDGSLGERRFAMAYGRAGRLTGAIGMNRPRVVLKLRGMIRERRALADAKGFG
jgi:NADPH-dependent 2,4-dienoyl-CoA reductase/sulfur reductase-like enzyme